MSFSFLHFLLVLEQRLLHVNPTWRNCKKIRFFCVNWVCLNAVMLVKIRFCNKIRFELEFVEEKSAFSYLFGIIFWVFKRWKY